MSVPQEQRPDAVGGAAPGDADGRLSRGGPGAPPASGAQQGSGGVSSWRGQRLGLPESGPGSLAPFGLRVGAFLTDIVLSALVAGLFTAPELPRNWSLVAFLAEYVVFGAAFGQTPGMRLFGLRLMRVDGRARVGLLRAVGRTALLALLIPALIWDADGRCLHDRFTQTAVVRV